MEYNDSAYFNDIANAEAEADFWVEVTNWIINFFLLNENAEFTVESIFYAFTEYPENKEFRDDKKFFESFKRNFKENINTIREEYCYDLCLVEIEEGWILTTNKEIIYEGVKFLEEKNKRGIK